MKANHEKNYKQVVGFQEIILQPGQFIFGRKIAATETALSEQKIRTCLSFLKKCKNLTIKPTNKFSIISIINWKTYQYIEEGVNQQVNQHVTSNQPASNHKQEPLNNLNKTPLNPHKGKIDEIKDFLFKNIPPELKQNDLKIIEFYEYRQHKAKKQRYQTTKAITGLFRDLNNCNAAGYDLSTCLDITMERGWQTPSVDYFKPEMFTSTLVKYSPKIKTMADREREEKELFANRTMT